MSTLEAITPFATALGLATTRIGALMMASPIFQSASIPSRLKGALTMVLAILVVLKSGPLYPVTPSGVLVDSMDGAFLLSAVARELMAGALMGLAATVTFSAIQMTGETMGVQMGFSVANVIDPTTRQQNGLITQLLNLMAVLIFLAVDGHLFLLKALFDSFDVVPLAQVAPDLGALMEIFLTMGTRLFSLGLNMALPVICVVLFVNVGLALSMRAVPQINIFAVGFILSIGLGLVVLMQALPSEGGAIAHVIEEAVSSAAQVVPLLGEQR
ncbi:MAG: flagellar biosynthetic protein FliR [Bradymonadia bacterium]